MQTHGAAFATYLQQENIPFLLLTSTTSANRVEEARQIDLRLGFQPLRLLPRGNFLNACDLVAQVVNSIKPKAVFSSQISFAEPCAGVPFVCRTAGNDIYRPWTGPCDISFASISKLPITTRLERLEVNRKWVASASRRCSVLLCNSHFTADLLAARVNVPMKVVTGGVDTDLFFPRDREAARGYLGWLPDEYILLAACRLVVKKGLDVAIQAIAQCKDRPRLKIVGTGPEYSLLVGLAAELGVGQSVDFLGAVQHTDLPVLFAAADAVVMPSRTAYDIRRISFDFETMGRTAIEGSASGVPVLASRAGALPEIVKDGLNGRTFPENDASGLAKAIQALQQDRHTANSLGQQGRALAAREWTFNQVNHQFLEHLGEYL